MRAAHLALLLFLNSCYLSPPRRSRLPALPEDQTMLEGQVTAKLAMHVQALAGAIGPRDPVRKPAAHRSTQAYIESIWSAQGYVVDRESVPCPECQTFNLFVELPGATRHDQVVVVGAHHDTIPSSPGADDNASGVAALLVLSELLNEARLDRAVRFVAFGNEEPPFFETSWMGSRLHAEQSKERGDKIKAMISLDSIGYYSDEPGSQDYPGPLAALYPDVGLPIGIVGNVRSTLLVRRISRTFHDSVRYPQVALALPRVIEGISWSDHASFWREGVPAVLVTDSAPYRNPNYHRPSDLPDTLDYARMARVVRGLAAVITDLANKS